MASDSPDSRPAVALGHVSLEVSDLPASAEFFTGLGMREIVLRDSFAVLELRGGSHLILNQAEGPVSPGTKVPFDLMVDDIEATRDAFEERGLSPSGFEKGQVHTEFTISEPDGCIVTMTSSHTSGRVV
ncbi:MAG: VOC family protein [Nitrospinota bacterium]